MGWLFRHVVLTLFVLALALALLPTAPAFAALLPAHPLSVDPAMGTMLHTMRALTATLVRSTGPTSAARHISIDGRMPLHCLFGCPIVKHPFPPPPLAHGSSVRLR